MSIDTLSPSETAAAYRKAERARLQAEKNAARTKSMNDKLKPKKEAPKKVAKLTPDKDVFSAPVAKSNIQPPTTAIAAELQYAFDYFNRDFFEGKLPPCVLTLTRLRKYAGQFAAKRWISRSVKAKEADLHEIQIDAVVMRELGDKRALSTLLHEMIHLAVEHAGKGPKRAYHCKTWATVMKEMGLQPVAIVKKQRVEGKETGAHCTHDIIKGGPFDTAADELLATGFQFSWGAVAEPEKVKGKKKSKAGAKVKYSCGSCDTNFWGKGGIKAVCKECDEPFVEENQGDDSDE